MDAIAERFLSRAKASPFIRSLLESFSADETRHVASVLRQHLDFLLQPGLTAVAHRDAARRIGSVHVQLGLEQDDAVLCIEALTNAIRAAVDPAVHAEGLAVLTHRLNLGLYHQTETYNEVRDARRDLILSMTRAIADVDSYAGVIDVAVNMLGEIPSVADCAVGYPDALGGFHVVDAHGEAVARYMHQCSKLERSPEASRASEQGPIGLAWSTGQVQRSINISTDPRMTLWRDFAAEAGFRSMIAIPLHGPDGAPMLNLVLYSAMPGGYSGPAQQDFITLVQALVELALARIWRQKGCTENVPYLIRQRWQSLLRTDALEMHFQPLLDLRERRVTKVEALARLRDGDRLLGPGQFLGALQPEDYFVLYVRGLRQVMTWRARWLQQGADLAVSINLPPAALADIRYFEATRAALVEYGGDPSAVTLELLESGALPAGVSVPEEIERFRSLGVHIALDDLGAGYGSLNRLRDFPFDAIKIDQNIASSRGGDHWDMMRFIYQLTRLGHSLGKPVVIEGVEDEDLLQALPILGPDLVQGYAVARPMPPDEIVGWLASRESLFAGLSSEGRLARLARLLLWEEGIHLNAEMARGDGAPSALLADIAERRPGYADHSVDAKCLSCIFSSLPIQPRASTGPDDDLVSNLVHAAVCAGVGSELYKDARARLIGDLQA
ncbi:EAL domain-containing protein [Uliginosibacterium sp. sgz301328]|uniref:EAL domain-containing protein n=1 Tax=Uliginosibacterium sp. sgz301328 TaxID=3243764 RepID=UPI00359CD012